MVSAVSVAQALAEIRQGIARLTSRPVEIVGVTKGQSVETIREGIQSGLQVLGNNYEQEGRRLIDALGTSAAKWHFIGHLQSRKVRQLLDYQCIQSLDRISIAEELHSRLQAVGKSMEVFVQVNIGDEQSKSGIAPERLEEFLQRLQSFSSLRTTGLMSLPPALDPVELRRPCLAQMRELFDRFSTPFGLQHLSMGTTDDYPLAVEEGSTMIRLGTALFGARTRAVFTPPAV